MKKLTLLIIPLICSLLFTGCGKIYFTNGVSSKNVFEIEGEVCTYQEALLYITSEKKAYEVSFGNDMWKETIGDMTMEEYVKDGLKNKLSKIECMNLLAKEEGISLSSEEEENVKNAAEKYFSLLTAEEIEEMDMTVDTVKTAYSKYAISEKVYISLTQDLQSEISDADAKVIKVQSIYMKSDETQLKKILKKIESGSDFYTLAVEYSEDEELEYDVKKGDTLSEYEEAAFALKTGEVSDVIKTEKGFYIIKCVSDYLPDESASNKANLLEQEKEAVFKAVYNPFVDKLKYKFNNRLWKKVKLEDIITLSEADYYGVYEEYCK